MNFELTKTVSFWFWIETVIKFESKLECTPCKIKIWNIGQWLIHWQNTFKATPGVPSHQKQTVIGNRRPVWKNLKYLIFFGHIFVFSCYCLTNSNYRSRIKLKTSCHLLLFLLHRWRWSFLALFSSKNVIKPDMVIMKTCLVVV